ncbi:MAG: hypothetical protein J1F37_04340 [Oscillospiraceae bacterium]|nr:hypothetical protein [Oscillospiraceae bacterium]
MKYLIVAAVLFVIGIILAIISTVKYLKAKKAAGGEPDLKPHAIRFGIVFLLFIIAQILLIIYRH